MAKVKTESVRAREARLKAEAAAGEAAEAAAKQAAQEAELAAEAARQEVERRRAEKAAPKPKRARFVRADKVAAPEVAAAVVPLPTPSTKLAGKLFSKHAKPVPKGAVGPNRGPAVPREKRQIRHEGVSRK